MYTVNGKISVWNWWNQFMIEAASAIRHFFNLLFLSPTQLSPKGIMGYFRCKLLTSHQCIFMSMELELLRYGEKISAKKLSSGSAWNTRKISKPTETISRLLIKEHLFLMTAILHLRSVLNPRTCLLSNLKSIDLTRPPSPLSVSLLEFCLAFPLTEKNVSKSIVTKIDGYHYILVERWCRVIGRVVFVEV